MSLGKLLAAGKSLVGLRNDGSRYRVDKQARLPKFNSPKNPFIPAEQPVAQTAPAPVFAETVEPRPVVATARAGAVIVKQRIFRAPVGARVTVWLGEWRKKLNPLLRRKARRSPFRSAGPGGAPPAIQPELSLDRVQVVRNDLSDTDFEVVKSARSPGPGAQMMAATAQKLEPVGAVWNRLTTRFFGEDQL